MSCTNFLVGVDSTGAQALFQCFDHASAMIREVDEDLQFLADFSMRIILVLLLTKIVDYGNEKALNVADRRLQM